MSAVTLTTTITNGRVPNGKLETGINGYRKNGYVKPEPESPVSTHFIEHTIIQDISKALSCWCSTNYAHFWRIHPIEM